MSYASEVLADSPYVYLKLNETSGTVAADSSGNARDGTYVSTPTLGVTGLVPTSADLAASFGGSPQHVTIPDDNGLDGISAFTVEAWIKPTAVSSVQIAARDGAGANRSFQFSLASGKLTFIRIAGSVVTATGATTLVSGTTYHVAAVYNGTDIRLYINSVLDNTPAACTGTMGTSGELLRVCARRNSTPIVTDYFTGVVDEFAAYTTALSSARIAAHYTAGTVASTAATGTGSLSLSGSGATSAAATGSGSLSLSGSGAAGATAAGSGSLSLSGSVASSVAATGAGALSLSATGAAGTIVPASGSGSLSLTGSGAASAVVVGSGSLSLSASGDTSVAVTGAGSLSLSGSGTATSSIAATGSGSLTLSGLQASPASGTGSLTLSATGAAEALYLTDTSNLLNGRVRRARGTSTVAVPVGVTPSRAAVRYDKSVPLPPPTLVDGRPT